MQPQPINRAVPVADAGGLLIPLPLLPQKPILAVIEQPLLRRAVQPEEEGAERAVQHPVEPEEEAVHEEPSQADEQPPLLHILLGHQAHLLRRPEVVHSRDRQCADELHQTVHGRICLCGAVFDA